MSDEKAGAYAQSENEIEQFAGSLTYFAGFLTAEMDTIRRQGRDAVALIEQRRNYCIDLVARLEAEASAAEFSESTTVNTFALATAYAELEQVTSLCSQAQECLEQLNVAVSRLQPLTEEVFPLATKFLMGKADMLRAYHAVRLDTDGSKTFPVQLPQVKTTNSAQALHSWPDITQIALPGGFAWIPLDSIALKEELKNVRGANDFNKVAYDEMKSGAQRFISQVLPVVHKDKTLATSEYFAELDRKAGLPYVDGVQRVFDAFLGCWSPIYLCRGAEGGQFSITNGRHRIKVALDLGWPAIPAQVKDLSTRAKQS